MCLHPAFSGPKRLKLLHHCSRVNEPFYIERIYFQGLFYFVPLSLKLSSLWCKASFQLFTTSCRFLKGKACLASHQSLSFYCLGLTWQGTTVEWREMRCCPLGGVQRKRIKSELSASNYSPSLVAGHAEAPSSLSRRRVFYQLRCLAEG